MVVLKFVLSVLIFSTELEAPNPPRPSSSGMDPSGSDGVGDIIVVEDIVYLESEYG
jgi:hypothetical protein